MPLVSTSSQSGAQAAPRIIEVAPERLSAWLAGFAERHGGEPASGTPHSVTAPDGVVARLEYFHHDPLGVILVRRGGYAVGRVRAGKLLLHKVGTRYVQGKTAAGGWSQQRYARRRENQADELVAAVADHAARILVDLAHVAEETGEIPVGGIPMTPGLVVGGDRQLVSSVLSEKRLGSLRELPRRSLYDIPDPNRAVLETAIKRATAVRISLSEAHQS